MSSGTGVWRQAVARAAQLRARALGVATGKVDRAIAQAPNTAITALAQQVFFASIPRSRVLFVTADDGTNMPDFCERIGRAVAEISHGRVGLVTRNRGPAPVTLWAKESLSAIDLGGNLWRIPFNEYTTRFANPKFAEETLHLDYMVFGASIADGTTPAFCKECDGAVLVITASRTRREVALRAKELLLSWNVEPLGAVLDNRTFPVPESIYRRL